MKTMKQFTLVLLFSLLVGGLLAQEKIKVRADSLRIRFDNCLLEVATFDFKTNTLQKADIPSKITALLKTIEKVDFDLPEKNEKISIKFSGLIRGEIHDFQKLELTSKENRNKTLIVKEGELLETDFGNIILEVEDEDYLIRLHLENLTDANIVDSPEFMKKLTRADSEIPKNRKKTNTWLVENKNNSFNSYFLNETPPYTLDMLELSAGVGTGWIHNEFVSGFNFRLGFAFAKKGIMKNKYFADYEVLYNFSNPQESSKFTTNGFLSLGYARNFSMNPANSKWYGISVGYLLDRNNSFFEKNTFIIGIHKQINNSITLIPEIYIKDFNKNGSPALRVQVTF